MISWINDNKRGFSLIGIAMAILVGSLVLLDFENELSSLLLFSFSISILIYLVVTSFLKKYKSSKISDKKLSIENWTIIIILGMLLIISAIESNAFYPEMSSLIIVLFLLLVIFSALQFRADQIRKKGFSTINKKTVFNIAFWVFVLGIGRVILLYEETENQDLLIFTSLFYFFTLIFLTLRWIFVQTRTIYKLKNEQAKTELQHLKSQVSPHFFFNTLNNLYGLVEQDSKKARTLILKLSDMMRYSIYEGQKDQVTLEEEIDYLNNYIELHKMRYHKEIDIEFNTDIQKEGIKLMPLLFIILVENAFKHGVENLIEKPYVRIDISAKNSEVHFEVENNFDPSERNDQVGIGLKNLKRRLDLVYKNKHNLTFLENGKIYKAQLSLKLYD